MFEELQKAWPKGQRVENECLWISKLLQAGSSYKHTFPFVKKNDNSAEPTYQSMEARTMVSHLQIGIGLSLNWGTFTRCLDGFQNCCGSGCVSLVFLFGIGIPVTVLLACPKNVCRLCVWVGVRGWGTDHLTLVHRTPGWDDLDSRSFPLGITNK